MIISISEEGRNKKIHPIWFLIQIALVILAFYWVFISSDISFTQLVDRATHIALLPLFLGILFFVLNALINALRYSLLLPEGISMRYLTGVFLFQNTLITFIPWRVGEAGYPILLYRDHDIGLTKSISVLLLIRLLDMLIFMGIVFFLGGYRLSLPVAWIWAAMIAVAAGCVLLYLLNRKLKIPVVKDLIHRAREVLLSLRGARSVICILGLSFALVLTTSLQVWSILRSISFHMNYLDVIVFNAVTMLASVLPVHPPGGWGTIDSIQSITLTTMGYQMSEAVTSVLVAHSIYSVLIFAGGLAGWILRKNALGK